MYIENIDEKGRNCSPGAILFFSTILCNLILDSCVKTRIKFSLRDKQLFEIIEVELMRVDCIFHTTNRIFQQWLKLQETSSDMQENTESLKGLGGL